MAASGQVAGAASGAAMGTSVMPGIGTAVGALAGALMSGGSSDNFHRKDYYYQLDQQSKFASKMFKNRIRDAKKMGLHPLFALGQPIAQPSAIPVGDSGGSNAGQIAGQALGNIASRFKSDAEREMEQLQLAQLRQSVATDAALEGKYASEAALARQSVLSTAPKPDNLSLVEEGVKVVPDQVVSGRPSAPWMTAGTHPGLREYWIGSDSDGDAVPVLMPWSDEGPAEAAESIPFWMMPRMLEENVKTYGFPWINRFMFGMAEPKKKINLDFDSEAAAAWQWLKNRYKKYYGNVYKAFTR